MAGTIGTPAMILHITTTGVTLEIFMNILYAVIILGILPLLDS